jgi:cardiolipin synthase
MNENNKASFSESNPENSKKYSGGHRISGKYRINKGDFLTAFRRGSLVIVSIMLQFAVLLIASEMLLRHALLLYLALELVGVIFAINIVYDSESYRYFWFVIILLNPVIGLFLYLFWGSRFVTSASRAKMKSSIDAAQAQIPEEKELLEVLDQTGNTQLACARYLTQERFPLFRNTSVRYYPLGDDMAEDMFADLRAAKERIWIEYFIVLGGEIWDEIEEILKEKVKEGVDVRLLVDDVGSIRMLNRKFKRRMKECGIKLRVFAPIYKDLTKLSLNYRNHQKALIVDRNIAYTGGINMSDEYFNLYPKYGHWKDTAVRLEGEAAASLEVMFVSVWNYSAGKHDTDYIPVEELSACPPCGEGLSNGGLVQPFFCGPLKDRHNNADMVYQSIMRHAKKYLYITTPYLVLDRAMTDALIRAAKCGVDVRIYTPRHYDKWYVYRVTEGNYGKLLREGIRIFEYVPGFIHAKNLVVDDECAICGSINLDYRSFYFHYECATVFYGGATIFDIKKDILETEKICEEILLEKWRKRPLHRKFVGRLLGFLAPLF